VDLLAEFAKELYWELLPIVKWAARNWSLITASVLILVCWKIRHKHPRRRV